MNVGKRIEETMKLKGISRHQLSKRTNLSEASISRYINEEREPKMISLISIARALDVKVDDLIGENENGTEEIGKAVMVIARNAKTLTTNEKKTLMNALIGE